MIFDWISNLFDNDKDKEKKTEQAQTPTSVKKEDPFLEGFNYYNKEKPPLRDFTRQAMQQRIINPIDSPVVVKKKEEDPFLASFNYYSNERTKTPKSATNVKIPVKDAQNKGKSTFSTKKSLGEKADNLRVLDDVTNTLFKSYDKFVNTDIWDIVFKNNANVLNLGRSVANHLIAEHNYKKNQEVDLSNYENSGGYINDQNNKGSKMIDLRYGSESMDDTGCELIAVHNSLNTLNNKKDLRDIARDFEKDGKVLNGFFGTSPYAVGDYFRKQGYSVKTYEGDKTIENLELPESDTYILSFWNSPALSSAVHTVSLRKRADGTYIAYNSSSKGTETSNSIKEYLQDNGMGSHRVPLVLHCISRQR